MSKAKLLIYGCICMFLISCGSPAEIPPTVSFSDSTIAPTTIIPTPQSDGGTDVIEVEAPLNENDPTPTATAIILNTVVPSATPTVVTEATWPPFVVGLTGLRFSTSEGGVPANQFFAPNELFVEFDYAYVPDGSLLRRDWYFNDELFISREESWSGELYGSDGVRSDISLFDFESGLAPGSYRVELFLNGDGQGTGEFLVLQKPEVKPTTVQKFSGLSFKGIGPYSMEIGDRLEQPIEMFAEWSYVDMVSGDLVRRDWYYNNEPFITREEAWDFAKYGESGRVNDVSIYDYETGLFAGNYRLELYINDQLQIERSVEIVEHYQLSPLLEPISGKQLLSDNLNTMTVINPDGTAVTQAVAGRIQSADWFPGGDQLVFSTQTLADLDEGLPIFAHKSSLWFWDLTTNTLTQIGSQEDNYKVPRVSPDGQYVAILAGTGFGDAGYVDFRLIIFQVDSEGTLYRGLTITDFDFKDVECEEEPWAFLSNDETYRANAVEGIFKTSDRTLSAGQWIDATRLQVTVGFPNCEDDYGFGTYELNLEDMSAEYKPQLQIP